MFRPGDLLAILRGEYQISRVCKLLRLHGLIKETVRTCKYCVNALGHRELIAALKLKEHLFFPCLKAPVSTP